MNKTERSTIRQTPKQKSAFEAPAKALNMSVADFWSVIHDWVSLYAMRYLSGEIDQDEMSERIGVTVGQTIQSYVLAHYEAGDAGFTVIEHVIIEASEDDDEKAEE